MANQSHLRLAAKSEESSAFRFSHDYDIPDTYSCSALVAVSEHPTSTLVPFEDQAMNPGNSGWYDLIAPATCQGCSTVKDGQNKEWSCSGCGTTFRSKYEAKRHIATAGMEVRCRYCDKVVNANPFVLKRHVDENSRCLRIWGEREFTGERTVDGAFRA